MWISRTFSEEIHRLAAQRPVVVLTGARQTGKSSLLQHLFPDHHHVTLDLPSEAASAEFDPDAFLARHPPPVVIDEVQYAPGIIRHLKRWVDRHRGTRGQIILTGSQLFTLMQGVSESLAGRAAILELPTLSYAEARSVGAVPLEDYLVRGGYPELWADRSIDARDFYRSYVATYLERDLRSQLRVTDLRDFERFVRACALRSAQLLNKSDLARDIGISVPTAGAWLGALQASGLVALLEPWHANEGKRLAKTPKLYFCDTGLLAFLVNLQGVEGLHDSPLRGALFETLVFTELRRALALRAETDALFFWRDRTTEVDFVLHRAGRFHLWEAKWSELPRAEDATSLRKVRATIGPERVVEAALVTRAPHRFPLGDGVDVTDLPSLVDALAAGPSR
ncbi:MAG: ATP-binding protein [Deltaproteobacteria bacterium]|nr:ATP-binding protein [Deltaproteobacteria bacterium]